MGVATGCGSKEVYISSSPLVSVLFYSSIFTFCSIYKIFFVLVRIRRENNAK